MTMGLCQAAVRKAPPAVPAQSAVRVWDVQLCQGPKVLYRVAMASQVWDLLLHPF